MRGRFWSHWVSALVFPLFAIPYATAETPIQFDLPAQSLAESIRAVARETNTNVVFDAGIVTGKRAPALKAQATAEEALDFLLRGTGLAYQRYSDHALRVASEEDLRRTDNPKATAKTTSLFTSGENPPAPREGRRAGDEGLMRVAQNEKDPATPDQNNPESPPKDLKNEELSEVVVTGTNIKGVAPAGSPVIVLDQETIRRSGYTSTEQLIQSLPQNVRGAEGATADAQLSAGVYSGYNATFGSGVNLRGLGSGATLTLINGRRVAASSSGTFTDISLIPLNAIERIEILMDGASAIYGADAVAGVINLILKQDYEGSETRARYGFTSPGGRDEMRLSQTLGGAWNSGNGLVLLDYLKQTELGVDERDFTSNVSRPTSIYPENKQLALLLSGTQRLGNKWSTQADAQYTRAKRKAVLADGTGTVIESPVDIDRVSGALSLVYSPSESWDISLDGLVSREDIDFSQLYYLPGASEPDATPGSFSSVQDQVQKQWSSGLKATGRLFELPAGPVGIAIGVDHRVEDYEHFQTALSDGVRNLYRASQREVDAAFAEIHLPLFGASNRRTGLERLDLSLAGRYDDYSDFGSTTNPKVGLSWVPFNGLEFRSSYSTSFRAPPTGRILSDGSIGASPSVPIFSFATADGSATIPVVYLGGSRDLEAEESENWTVGFTFRPTGLDGLTIGLTYYEISYTNRITTPPYDQGALSNPALQIFLTSYDSPAQLLAAVEQLTGVAPQYFDYTGADFNGGEFGPNPQNIATDLFDGRQTNAAVVNTSGVDITVAYALDWLGGALNLGLNTNRIEKIDTQFSPTATTVDIVDTTGNPVALRLRTTAAYSRAGWDAAIGVNYTDGYTDTTGVNDAAVSDYLTVDCNFRYTLKQTSSDMLQNLSFALSVTNLFNESPPFVEGSGSSRGAHYDPANADPLGRLIALEIAKRW